MVIFITIFGNFVPFNHTLGVDLIFLCISETDVCQMFKVLNFVFFFYITAKMIQFLDPIMLITKKKNKRLDFR